MKSLIIFISIFVCQNAWSWGDMGHATVAHIAQQYLSPKTKAAVESILGVEFMAIAATWPDAVRSDSRYKDFAPYHFIEVPPGQTIDTVKRPPKDALTVLEKFPAIIKDPKSTRYQKLIALRYIIHVVGDVHQPLHVGNGLDRGANSCTIQWVDKNGKAQSSNLHSFWDDKIVDQIADFEKGEKKYSWFDYTNLAPKIIERYKNDPEFAVEVSTDPKTWITQSQELRLTVVYPDREIDAENRLYCAIGNRSVKPEDVPLITRSYIDKALPVAEKQIMRGGKRLAAYLETVFQDYPEGINDKDVLDSMNIVN